MMSPVNRGTQYLILDKGTGIKYDVPGIRKRKIRREYERSIYQVYGPS
jgi:hypothetical protein